MGEAKRRREAAGAAGDAGFPEYRNHFKRHFPKSAERDIGEGWMRQFAADVDHGTPEQFTPPAGAVAVHVVFGEATLNAGVAPGEIAAAVADWAKLGYARNETKDLIMSALVGNYHMQQQSANAVVCAALWLAYGSERAAEVRHWLAQPDTALTYLIFDSGGRHPTDGRTEFTFRLLLSQRNAFPEP